MSRRVCRRVEDTYPVHMKNYISQLNDAERRRAAMTPYIRANPTTNRYFLRSSVHAASGSMPQPSTSRQDPVVPETTANNQAPKPPTVNAEPNSRYPLKPQNVGMTEEVVPKTPEESPNGTPEIDLQQAGPSNSTPTTSQLGLRMYPAMDPAKELSDFDAFIQAQLAVNRGESEQGTSSESKATEEEKEKEEGPERIEEDEDSDESDDNDEPPTFTRVRNFDPDDEPDPKRRKLLHVAQTVQALARANAVITRVYRNVYSNEQLAAIAADLELSVSDYDSELEDDDIDMEEIGSIETEEDLRRIISQIPIPIVDDDDWLNCDSPPAAILEAVRAVYPDEDMSSPTPYIHSADPRTRDAEMRAIEAIQKFQTQVHRLLDRNFLSRHAPGAHLLPMHCIFINTMRSVFPVFMVHPDLLTESQNRVMDEISERRLFILKKLSMAKPAEDGDLVDNCVICQADFEKDQTMRALRCGHKFHVVCIDNWCRTSLTCPMCRRGVDGHVLLEEEAIPVRAPLATLRSLEFIRTYLVMRRYSYTDNSVPLSFHRI